MNTKQNELPKKVMYDGKKYEVEYEIPESYSLKRVVGHVPKSDCTPIPEPIPEWVKEVNEWFYESNEVPKWVLYEGNKYEVEQIIRNQFYALKGITPYISISDCIPCDAPQEMYEAPKGNTKTISMQEIQQDIMNKPKKHSYSLKIYNGRIKVYIDGYVMFSFNQIDFSGYYAYKDDTNLYGLDIYLNREKAGHQIMEVYFKTKENWLSILKLLDENL